MNKLALSLATAAVVLLLVACLVVLRVIDSAQRSYTRGHMVASLATVVAQARQMAEDDIRRVATFAQQPSLLPMANAVVAKPDDLATFERLRQALEPIYRSRGFVGFSLISADQVVVAASSPAYLGYPIQGSAAQTVLLRARLHGAAISPPIVAPLPVTHDGVTQPAGTLFQLACARLLDQGQLSGYLCLRADPQQRLFRFLQASRTGRTGEAYVVDEQGLILSPGRFGADQSAAAKPSRLIEQMLRNKATSTGYLENYRDYRGVAVVGAGQWLPEIGMGVVVEEDLGEAFYTSRVASIAVVTLTAIAVVLLIALMLAQRALRRRVERSERQLRTFSDNSPNSVVLWSLDGRALMANTQFEALLGLAPGSARGMQAEELLKQEWLDVSRRFERVTHYGETIKLTRRGTGDRVFQVTNFPVHEANGAMLGVGSIIVDISEQARAQQALEQLNHELEARVEERTAELSRARDAAETAARSKAEFLANMSHEIRTPLNAVIGMSQLAQRSSRDPGIALQLRRIHDAGQHLLGIVNGILDFSSLESGAIVVASEPFSLLRVVEHCIGMNSEQGAAKGLELAIHIEPGTPDALVGDQLHLAQILTNLLSNAVKFTNHGEVMLRLSIAKRDTDSVHLRIAVRDTGIGIAPDKLGELFQPFHQLDTSLARRYEGTGLGLVITRRLVQLMGGTIDVASSENSGTEFTVELPFRLGTESAVSTGILDLGCRRVLVVDPHDEARRTLVDPLRALCWRVEEASRCDEAFALLNQGLADTDPYELVFVDSRVPDLDPGEVARKLQQLTDSGSRPHCVLLVPTTADASVRDSLPGADAVLTKPAFGSPLFDLIVRLFAPMAGDTSLASSSLLQGPHPELVGRHLLLVEDNPINREVAKEMLSLFGASVATAADGMQALQTLNADLFDLVLMDLHMPVMDGIEATAAIRRDPRFAALPVIALTADVMSENQGALRTAGVNAILNKPLDADRLLAELIRWLPPRNRTTPTSASAAVASKPEHRHRVIDDRSASLLAKLRALPGINVEAALARMLNRSDIYLAFVRNIVAATADTDVKLRAAVAANDNEAMHDVVHGLKSLYASLGADDIAARCGNIERELMEGRFPPSNIDDFLQAWKTLHIELNRFCVAEEMN